MTQKKRTIKLDETVFFQIVNSLYQIVLLPLPNNLIH